MPDTIRDLRSWHGKLTDFKEFANKQNAEFQFNVLPNGKEVITVRLYYRPVKQGEKDERINTAG